MPRNILCSPDTCGGAPRLDGTRLTCADVVQFLRGGGLGLGTCLELNPQSIEADLAVALDYCAQRSCLVDQPVAFCSGCSLDQRAVDPVDTAAEDPEGPGEELWLLAQQILPRFD